MYLLLLVIFGSSLFSGTPIEPSNYQEVPADYVLGRGDSVIVNLYGTSQMQINQSINADGTITIPVIGPVKLSGMSLNAATRQLKSAIAHRYADSEVQLTIASPRTIEVTLRGEVKTPGHYRLHGYSTLSYALQKAGGIADEGSMRQVQLIQNGKKQTIDLYNNLLVGKKPNDPRLRDGAEILVPTAGKLVKLDGLIKRKATYELMPEQTIGDLIAYADSTTEDDVRVRIQHRGAESSRIETMSMDSALGYQPADGDSVAVEKIPDNPDQVVQVFGNVKFGGKYLVSKKVHRLSQLLSIAVSTVGDKPNVVIVYRDTNLVQVGDQEMELQGKEKIYVLPRTVYVNGEVNFPAHVDYTVGMTPKQYIQRAGGYTKHAAKSKSFIVMPDGKIVKITPKVVLIPGIQIVVPKR